MVKHNEKGIENNESYQIYNLRNISRNICEGRPVRSKALASGANPEGVRGFKSHPSHQLSF